jgi:polyisoprenoid-binding protein YceI
MNKKLQWTLALLVGLATPLVQARPDVYGIDPTHTFVTFEARHYGTSTVRGRFDRTEGTIRFDPAGKTGKAVITLATDSVSTGVAAFDNHLKGKEFFNAAVFPGAQFVGERFTFAGDKVIAVAGRLTLLGKTHPLTLTASHFNCYQHPVLKRDVCGGDFEATLQRSQWGLGQGVDQGIPDSIRLLIQVEAVKQ